MQIVIVVVVAVAVAVNAVVVCRFFFENFQESQFAYDFF